MLSPQPTYSRRADSSGSGVPAPCRRFQHGWAPPGPASRLFGWILLLSITLPIGFALGEELAAQNPDKVKAAYILNFTRYVTWPTNAFARTNAPWHIGLLGGDNSLADALEKILQGRVEQGRGFEIHRADAPGKLPDCQIVFVAFKDSDKRQTALAAFKDKPVLTVGDEAYFLQDGGIIRFQTTDRVRMSINLDQARSVALNVQTKMLEVSYAVLENGELRKLK